MRIEFSVPMQPVPQPRQRFRVVKPHDGSTLFMQLFASTMDTLTAYKQAVRQALDATYSQNYTPKSHAVNAFKEAVQLCFRVAHKGPPLDGPIGLSVLFVLPRSTAKVWKRKPMPREWAPTAKADIDNLLKAIMDALNKLAWTDDRRICMALPRKCIAAGNERPHAEIVIETLDSDPTPTQRTQEEAKALFDELA